MSAAVEANAAGVAKDAPYPPRAVGWYATILLAFLYWLSVLDRFIISLLVEPIKRDLGLTDLQFGMLHGFAFALTFALFGLWFGALADRRSRRGIIFLGVSVWSVATAACGFAQNFWHLAIARVGVGAGEAALNPCATSMLADLFPRERLTLAMAVYAMGATLGAGTAFLVGGAIVSAVAGAEVFTLPVIGEVRSWQAVFFIVGLPGTVLSLAIFTVPEPVRRGVQTVAHGGRRFASAYRDLWSFMKTQPRFFAFHYAGFAFAAAVVVSGASWFPVHMGRTFRWSPLEIGMYLGTTLIIAAVIGKIVAGKIMDELFRRGRKDAQLRWYVGCLVVAVPISVIAYTSANPAVFLVGVGLTLMLLQPLPVCAYTALNLATPNHLRGTGVAFFAATSGLVGGGLGPILVPAAGDTFYSGPASIGLGLATVSAICCPIAAALLWKALGPMREAVQAAEQAISSH